MPNIETATKKIQEENSLLEQESCEFDSPKHLGSLAEDRRRSEQTLYEVSEHWDTRGWWQSLKCFKLQSHETEAEGGQSVSY